MRRLLWPHLKPRLPAFAAALGLALLIAALSAAQPLLTRMVIDQGLIAHRFPRLVAACAGCSVSRRSASCWAARIGRSTCGLPA